MKEKLKYIIAVLTAGTVGAWFLTYAKIGTAEFSLLGTLKAGLGFYKGTEEQELIYAAARTCLEPYTWWIAVGVFLILLGAFFIAVLEKRAPYIIGMTASLVDCAVFATLLFLLYGRLKEAEEIVLDLDKGNTLSLQIPALLILAVCYLVLFLLSLTGLLLWKQKKPEVDRAAEENGRLEDKTIEMPYAEYETAGYETEKMAVPEQAEQVLQERLFEEEQERERAAFLKEQEEPFVQPREECGGELCAESGQLKGKRYPMKETAEIYFLWADGCAVLSPYESPQALASVRFEQERAQYCIEPFEVKTMFLESGQPLGKGRQYYVPRGTRIYLKNNENVFVLI